MTERKLSKQTESDSPSKDFDHGDFWDSYSKSWDDLVGSRIGGGILGEEWAAPDRTQFVFERFALPFLRPDARVVEIGPGGGKFSRLIIERCHELALVDISQEMLQRANAACSGRARELLVQDGNLEALASSSVDLVFSYDVFIHLEAEEIFRYFAEVNRVLIAGGIFSVHSSTYESRWGFHSFLQQMRDNHRRIGERYGGRMYPLTSSILRRFAEHSGFEVSDHYHHRDDKDIIFALRKTRPSRPWIILSQPDLAQQIEISERVGGSDTRELFALRDLTSGQLGMGLVGDSGDSRLEPYGTTSLPEHPCLPKPQNSIAAAGISAVVFEDQRGRPIDLSLSTAESWLGLANRLAQLVHAVITAHGAGFVHGELSADFVIEDRATGCYKLYGLYSPTPELRDSLVTKDLENLAHLLGTIPQWPQDKIDLVALVEELAGSPSAELALRIAAALRR